jgi:plastocyanin
LRRFTPLLVLVAVTAALATSALAQRTATPTLIGTVGPGFTITVKMNNKVVKTLKAGSYRLVVHDKASIHAFSLDGPHGYAKDFTAVPFTGTKTFSIKLKVGAYKYYCPPHESTMFGRFTVK